MRGQNNRINTSGKGRIPFLVILTVLLGFAVVCPAADIAFDVQPRVLTLGESAVCTFSILGAQDAPPPNLPGVQGVQISQAGTERSFSMGSGGNNSTITYRYQIFPTQPGTFNLGPFTYSTGGQSIEVPAIAVEVVPPGASAGGGGAEQTALSDILFARILVDPPQAYNQQVFSVILSIYSRGINLAREVSLANMPTVGLSLSNFQELQSTREVVNNNVYDVRRFKGTVQALTAGKFTLEPVVRANVLVPRERQRSRDPFDSMFDHPFFGGGMQAQPVDLKTEPVEVVVMPLPSNGQPPGYAGAVGRFAFNLQAKPLELKAGEPITVSMEVAGEGNIENASAPSYVENDLFKVYETRLLNKEINDARGAGRKLFEQVIIPKSEQCKELPALMFSFFNPEKGQYETIQRGPFPLQVHASAGGNAQLLQTSPDMTQPQLQLLGSDIVYLKPAPARWHKTQGKSWFLAPSFLGLQVAPFAACAALLVFARRRQELAVNVAKARRHKAPHSARAAVRKAEAALSQSRRHDFFEALWEAIASYFGHRLNLAPGEVSMELIQTALKRGGLDESNMDALRKLYDRCELERFGGGGSTMAEPERQEFNQLLDLLNETLKACEKVNV